MKTKLIIAALGTSLTVATSPALCGNPYLKGSYGYNALDNIEVTEPLDALVDFEEGYWVGGALGYQQDAGRIEVEISYTENDAETVTFPFGTNNYVAGVEGNINLFSTMVNGYYDFETNSPVRPYLGLGLGLTNAEVEGSDPSESIKFNVDTAVFAYQAIAGLEIELNNCVSLDLGYRFFKTNDFSLNNKIWGNLYRFETDYTADIFTAGVKINF